MKTKARRSSFERTERNVRIREIRAQYVTVTAPEVSGSDPDTLARIFFHAFETGFDPQENLYIGYLNSRNGILAVERLYRGTANAATVGVRDMLRNALVLGAVGIALGHNHPSFDPNPSAEDIVFTRRAIEAARLIGIDVVDHVVLGAAANGELRFVSMKQRGYI